MTLDFAFADLARHQGAWPNDPENVNCAARRPPNGWGDLTSLARAAIDDQTTGIPPFGDIYVILDDATGHGSSYLFRDPVEIITATSIDQMPDTFARLRRAVGSGHHVAGMLAYEAGTAFEDRLVARDRDPGGWPLVWFGVFPAVQRLPVEGQPFGTPGSRVDRPCLLWREADHRRAVEAVLDLIRAGDVYQINLTFQLLWKLNGDPLAHYARWRAMQRAGWGGVVSSGSRQLLSLSPELFFSAQYGCLHAKPMKGTARRGRTAQEDRARIAALSASAKDRAENLMIVDLLRNDLARIAKPGSVRVQTLFNIETYPTIHQMTSTITAALGPGLDLFDALAALFPCGSITGAPKIRAMEIIASIEQGQRGPYTGSIGYIGPDGDGAFNVAIRTIDFNGGTSAATMGVGSAIVADSVPSDEWAECLAKAAFITAKPTGQRDSDGF